MEKFQSAKYELGDYCDRPQNEDKQNCFTLKLCINGYIYRQNCKRVSIIPNFTDYFADEASWSLELNDSLVRFCPVSSAVIKNPRKNACMTTRVEGTISCVIDGFVQFCTVTKDICETK